MNSKNWIPRTTVGLRIARGPLLTAGEQCRWSAVALSATVIVAWLSDIFDGSLAHQAHTDSATLRLCETLALARQIRRRWQQQGTLGLACTVLLVCGLALCNSSSAQAQTLQHVTYVGGTALQGNGLHGKVSVLSVNAVEFLGPVSLSIPYDRLVSFESKSISKVHVGLFTEGLWRLAAPWPETRQLSLVYRDADEHAQVIVLEMSKGDEAFLVEVLKVRLSRRASPPPISLKPSPAAGSDRLAER